MDIPSELRLKVYRYYFRAVTVSMYLACRICDDKPSRQRRKWRIPKSLSILRTNKQVEAEGIRIMLQEATFQLDSIRPYMISVPGRCWAHMRKFESLPSAKLISNLINLREEEPTFVLHTLRLSTPFYLEHYSDLLMSYLARTHPAARHEEFAGILRLLGKGAENLEMEVYVVSECYDIARPRCKFVARFDKDSNMVVSGISEQSLEGYKRKLLIQLQLPENTTVELAEE